MAGRRLAATLGVLRIVNLRALRRHALRALLAAISLGGGVAVVVAVMIEVTSVTKAIEDVGYRIAGPAPMRILGAANRGGVTPEAMQTALAMPGVSAVVPVVRAITMVRTGDRETYVLALGIDCTARWMIDPAVCPPGRQEPPVPATSTTLSKSLDPSSKLVTDVGQVSLTGLQHVSQLDTVNHGLVVVLPLSAAKAQFARGDRVDMAYITLTADSKAPRIQAQLREALGPGYGVLSRSDPDRGFNVNIVLVPLLAIFALIAVGVGVILIAQITRLSIEERRHEIAVAAALGASPLSAVTGLLAEAALLGVIGSTLGALIGIGIAHPVVASASTLTQLYVGVNTPVVVEPGILALGVGIGVLLAILAAAAPSLSALRTAIASELSGRAAQQDTRARSIWPKAVALLAFGSSGVLAARFAARSGGLEQWQAAVSGLGVVITVIGMLTAAAYLSTQLISMARLAPARARGATFRVALTGLRANPTRTTAIAGAVAVPVAVAMLLSSFLVGINRGSANLAQAQASDRLVVTTSRFNDWGPLDAKVSPHTIAQLAALPGVERVEQMVEIEIALANGTPAYVRAEDHPTFPFPVLAGRPPQATLDANQLIIGGILAREQRLRVGDKILLGSGPQAQEMVVGTIVATPEVGGRRIYMPFRAAKHIFGQQPPGLVRIKPDSNVPLDQITSEINSTRFNQLVKVTDSAGYEEATASGLGRFLTTLNALKYGLLAIAFVSVSATLLLVGMRRRCEMALIQALGATRSKVFAVTTIEAIIASAVGAVLGAVLSVAIMESVRQAAVVNVGSVSPLRCRRERLNKATPKGNTMHFTSETSSNGVIERSFILDEITGVLWSPTSGTVGSPLLLAGHTGGMHKKAPGLVASALPSVTNYGFTVAAIDAPGHGDRPRNLQDQRWAEAIHQARAAGKPIAPIVIDYNMSLAERAVPEWQATLDALQALPEIGVEAPIGYGGVSLGVVTGLMLTAVESRIAAVSFGGVFVDDALIEAAGKITVPVEYRIPWDDEEFDRTSGVTLFDAFASKEKTLHAYSGRHYPVPEYERDSSDRFFARHLGRAADTASD